MAAIQKVWQDIRRVLPTWPVLAIIFGGIAVIWPVTFWYARHVRLTGDWYPAAGSASGAWLCVVLIGINVFEYVQVRRGKRERILPLEGKSAFQDERIGWVLAVGILLGWQFFK